MTVSTTSTHFKVRYEPFAPIARGGMAEVMLAVMRAGGGRKVVALKRIWPELASDPDFVAMFLDEAQLSVLFRHPHVVQTYEVLTDDERLALSMEYLHGQPLGRVLNRLRGPGDLTLPLRLRIVAQVLEGLGYAHGLCDTSGAALGVVHRDVSPQNVFVTYDGQTKLVDFGVAKTLAARHQTRPGAIKGKIAYMAPETIQRGIVDRRADLFAVGVMLWEMTAGRRLWSGMTDAEIAGYLGAGRPMPPLPLDGSVPAGLEEICARALAVAPEQRYQTAPEFARDIASVLVGSAEAQARSLGKVVALAFSAERAERQDLIERHLHAPGVASEVVPGVPIPEFKTTVWQSRPLPRPRTVPVLPAPAPPPPSGATLAPPVAPARGRRLRWQDGAALTALVAAVVAIVLALGSRHAPPVPAVESNRIPPPLRLPTIIPVDPPTPSELSGSPASDPDASPSRRLRWRGAGRHLHSDD
jgi:serine/threonine protein kinase